MLLKVGYAMLALAVMLAGVAAVLVYMDESAPSAAVKSAREPAPEPLKRTDPMVEPWREQALATPDPEEPEPEPAAEPAPRPGPPEPAPLPDPGPRLVAGEDPPEPTDEQIESAYEPRRYHLPDGAVMGLTMGTLGIRDVPVFDSVNDSALTYGVGHLPGSSMPWTEAPQRNVYIAGHRLGWPGTASHLVFYRLNDLGRGDEIVLKDRDGKKYTYRVTEMFKAKPGDSWVTGQVAGRDMVTLQTCSGPNWERRLIVRADRV